ncbi:amidohydrolase family protein [Actinocrispum sp. NPDC049592]|uniref:metal-dependent hydrolase family protein n=1 Tax=Actinocrispum sp. NPDC049592 TaxID=3154835 RepID=UPI00341879D7
MWLTNATLVDGTGADPVDGQAVLVEDGRISAIGGTPPAGAEVVDCSGLTLTPGLIDAHVHLGWSSDMIATVSHTLPVAELAADMFANCAQTLDAGFTTVRDCGGIDGGLAGVVAKGKIAGPRILQCGPIQCQTGGHGQVANPWEPTELWATHDVPGLRHGAFLSNSPDDMRRNVRESFRRGADFIKLCVTGGVVSFHDKLTDTQLTEEEIRVAVEECAARGTYVTVHAHNKVGIQRAVRAGVKCVEHGTDIDEETAALMASHGVAHVPTLAVVRDLLDNAGTAGLPPAIAARAHGVWERMHTAILASRAAGVRVGLGSDLIGLGQDHRGNELVLRAAFESPMAALVSATATNADILGIADQVGTVETGKQADIIAFAGNPLDTPTLFGDQFAVTLIIHNGRVVKDIR